MWIVTSDWQTHLQSAGARFTHSPPRLPFVLKSFREIENILTRDALGVPLNYDAQPQKH